MQRDGGPAFPQINSDGDGQVRTDHPGMSLREKFAGQAMQSLMTHQQNVIAIEKGDDELVFIVDQAYRIADQMVQHALQRHQAPKHVDAQDWEFASTAAAHFINMMYARVTADTFKSNQHLSALEHMGIQITFRSLDE